MFGGMASGGSRRHGRGPGRRGPPRRPPHMMGGFPKSEDDTGMGEMPPGMVATGMSRRDQLHELGGGILYPGVLPPGIGGPDCDCDMALFGAMGSPPSMDDRSGRRGGRRSSRRPLGI